MFVPLPTPEEMAAWDAFAIEEMGLKGDVLMENAARSALRLLLDAYGPVAGRTALVVAGSGNNGGDGFALARMLADNGARVRVMHTLPRNRYHDHARRHLNLAHDLGVDLVTVSRVNLSRTETPDIVIDALLGTGLTGLLSDKALGLVRFMNLLGEMGAFVLALDTPSGLCGHTGRPLPEAVAAKATATFGAPKLGLVLPEAAPYVGRLEVMDIGLPARVAEAKPVGQYLITDAIMGLLTRSDRLLHKGEAGSVLIVGGSSGLTGAPHLAGLGALRAGAGLVTLACPHGLEPLVKSGRPELMTLPLGHGETWKADMARQVLDELPRFDAVVVGPGLGRSRDSRAFLLELLAGMAKPTKPLILDADGLFHFGSRPELLPAGAVLTPHPGEMARLARRDTDAVQSDRVAMAREYAAEHGCHLVLKGPGTVIASPDRIVRVCPLAAPCLAVGGAGDVLAGVMAALLARGFSPLHAASLAVYWHALAGLLLERDHPVRGNLASEIAHTLPQAAKESLCSSPRT